VVSGQEILMKQKQVLPPLPNIKATTREFEKWIRQQITIVQSDLDKKHADMTHDPFLFLRATFYRWAQQYPRVCADLMDAPLVLGVGDLHIENFGTWRCADGRLIWGINDVDEVYEMPYTNDLVRLLTSARFAIKANKLSISVKDACEVVLAGYVACLKAGGRPYVLAEEHQELRRMAITKLKNPVPYWQKMDANRAPRSVVPDSALAGLTASLPEPGLKYRLIHRTAGEGSLGRQRYVVLVDYKGGRIAREAKNALPSAWGWAMGHVDNRNVYINDGIDRAVRCKDPYFRVRDGWVVRRLAPDCARVELIELPKDADERVLLEAMGWETANWHLGTPGVAQAILCDLKKRPKGWLHAAAKQMYRNTVADHSQWAE
jgi:hypothetical protein